MSLQALRRWIARHPLSWVLGLALALAGAQVAAAAHAATHVASSTSHGDLHASAQHDCPACLLAAALGGAAPAPAASVRLAPLLDAPVGTTVVRRFTPRTTLPYASRAPPTGA